MLSVVRHIDGPFTGTRPMGAGSRVPGCGVQLRRGIRHSVVRRILHLQTQGEVSPVRLCGDRADRLYGVWSLLVFTATINSVLTKVGESVLSNGQVGAITLNGAALGFIAFFFAKLFDVKLGNRRGTAISMLVAEVVMAVVGLLIMIRMFSVLYVA